ncbi:hypothetical protein HPB50_012959 [Hyalomma asiaticum]|uniref:Uncharacterized protein n=1 Tax=Hyalomma asiaticum TaxID=266040 RepID=A0ACB7RU39_HYAAI|nr:hypothetical protein HPB50_012959 [Hyalomma asiaticum]
MQLDWKEKPKYLSLACLLQFVPFESCLKIDGDFTKHCIRGLLANHLVSATVDVYRASMTFGPESFPLVTGISTWQISGQGKPEADLLNILQFVRANLNVDDSWFRSRLVVQLENVLVALRESVVSEFSRAARQKQRQCVEGTLEGHYTSAFCFVKEIVALAVENLFSGANYQRAITSLSILESLGNIFRVDPSGKQRSTHKKDTLEKFFASETGRFQLDPLQKSIRAAFLKSLFHNVLENSCLLLDLVATVSLKDNGVTYALDVWALHDVVNAMVAVMIGCRHRRSMSWTVEHLSCVIRECAEQHDRSACTVDLPQAEALHVLCAVVGSASLTAAVMMHLGRILWFCFEGLASPFWLVKNAAHQLYGVTAPRVLGLKKTREEFVGHDAMTALDLFAKFPDLRVLFLNKLDGSIVSTHDLYFFLDFLSRLKPPASGQQGLESLKPFQQGVRNHLGCRSWKLRLLAAKCISSFCQSAQEEAMLLIENVSAHSQNSAHAHLYAINLLLRNNPVCCPPEVERSAELWISAITSAVNNQAQLAATADIFRMHAARSLRIAGDAVFTWSAYKCRPRKSKLLQSLFSATFRLLQDEDPQVRSEAAAALPLTSAEPQSLPVQPNVAADKLFRKLVLAFEDDALELVTFLWRELHQSSPSALGEFQQLANPTVASLFEQDESGVFMEPAIVSQMLHRGTQMALEAALRSGADVTNFLLDEAVRLADELKATSQATEEFVLHTGTPLGSNLEILGRPKLHHAIAVLQARADLIEWACTQHSMNQSPGDAITETVLPEVCGDILCDDAVEPSVQDQG